MPSTRKNGAPQRAFVVTGPTSGIGKRSALELSRHGHVVLVGRDQKKLAEVRSAIVGRSRGASVVVADLTDLEAVRRAAGQVLDLGLPLAGVLNNAGVRPQGGSGRTKEGHDVTFLTNYLGPFVFTQTLVPRLSPGTTVVFLGSATEDPERVPAVAAGFRGGRWLSVEDGVQGRWAPDGSSVPFFDAYATSKQAVLAASFEWARQYPALRFVTLEPGIIPSTGLSRGRPAVERVVARLLTPVLAAFLPHFSTPARAGRLSAQVTLNPQGLSGVYLDERGHPMRASARASDPAFQNTVFAETQAYLGRAT